MKIHCLCFVYILLVFSQSLAQEDKDSLQVENLIPYLLPGNDSLYIDLPAGFKVTEESWYGEGVIITFSCPNSVHVLFHWGHMMSIPFLKPSKYPPEKEYSIKGYKSKIGIRQAKKNVWFWREDNYGRVNILYAGVKEQEVPLYNYILDSFRKQLFPKK